jgi:hypothetical protein
LARLANQNHYQRRGQSSRDRGRGYVAGERFRFLPKRRYGFVAGWIVFDPGVFFFPGQNRGDQGDGDGEASEEVGNFQFVVFEQGKDSVNIRFFSLFVPEPRRLKNVFK